MRKQTRFLFKLQKCSFQLTTSDANLCQFNIKPSPLSGATSDTKFDVMKLLKSHFYPVRQSQPYHLPV